MLSPISTVFQGIRSSVRTREISFSFGALATVVEAMGAQLSDYVPPPDDRLERLFARVCGQLAEQVPELQLNALEWLDVPWIAFMDWQGRMMCSFEPVRVGLAKAAAKSPTIRTRSIFVYLRDFDGRRAADFESYAAVLRGFVEGEYPDLQAWRERHQHLAIFNPNLGPARVANGLAEDGSIRPLLKKLGDIGFTSSLAAGGFSLAMFLEWCAGAHRRPREGMALIEEWTEQCSEVLSGRHESLVEALLRPWLETDPEPAWQTPLLDWLTNRYGDPRQQNNQTWGRVAPEIREIALRWLTLKTIEGFMETLTEFAATSGDEAMVRQWKYRQAFWLAFYRRRVVLDARAVVGPALLRNLGWQNLKNRFGVALAKMDGFESKQCALILRLRGLVVFVGTHNASCRLWEESSPDAPNLRAMTFFRDRIIADPRTDMQVVPGSRDTGIAHQGAEGGNWQRALRDFIYRRTGVSVPDRELMP